MTIYYGVWSGEQWWHNNWSLFHTPALEVAKAQAAVLNGGQPGAPWEVRAIGENGLPEPSPFTEEQQAWGASYFTPGHVPSEEA